MSYHGNINLADSSLVSALDFLWHIPAWAMVDIKPFCDWGAQVGAAYDWDPSQSTQSFPIVNASILWQPSPSCSRTASVNVSPP